MPPAALSQSGCHRGMGPTNGSRRHGTVGGWQTSRFELWISSSTMEKLNAVGDNKERTQNFYKLLHGFWFVFKQVFLIVQNFLLFEGYEGATSWKVFVCLVGFGFPFGYILYFWSQMPVFQILLIYKIQEESTKQWLELHLCWGKT